MGVVFITAGCRGHASTPVETFDFAGSQPADLSAVASDASEPRADAGESDLADVALTCDPGAALAGGGDPAGAWSDVAACASADAFYQLGCTALVFESLAVTSQNASGPPVSTLLLDAGQFDSLTIACSSKNGVCRCPMSFDADRNESGTWSRTGDGYTLTSSTLANPLHFSAELHDTVLRYRGDATTTRGDRGITYVSK